MKPKCIIVNISTFDIQEIGLVADDTPKQFQIFVNNEEEKDKKLDEILRSIGKGHGCGVESTNEGTE